MDFQNIVKGILLGLTIVSCVLIPLACLAEKDGEIAYLLQFVEQSQCIFVRNKTQHSSSEARQHMERKYKHIQKRVKTSEDFIRYAASRSSLSGNDYRVVCGEQEMSSSDWLQEALVDYRKFGKTP